jgi:hypothetical protein
MHQTFDDYNETCDMIDGSAAIYPHHLGLLMLRSISSLGPFGQAKQCGISALDTNYLMSADEVMANILHLAQNMEEDIPGIDLPAHGGPVPSISAFVAVGRGSHGGRGNPTRGGRAGRGLPNKCNGCGSLDHIMSSSTAYDDALLKWTLAKRKLIV